MLLSTDSTSSGASSSKGGANSARLVSASGMFPFYAMMRSCKALPNQVLAFPRRCLLWRLLPFKGQDLKPGSPYV